MGGSGGLSRQRIRRPHFSAGSTISRASAREIQPWRKALIELRPLRSERSSGTERLTVHGARQRAQSSRLDRSL